MDLPKIKTADFGTYGILPVENRSFSDFWGCDRTQGYRTPLLLSHDNAGWPSAQQTCPIRIQPPVPPVPVAPS